MKLKLWDLRCGACLWTFERHAPVALLPDGLRAISWSWDASLELWDLENEACLRTFEGNPGSVDAVAVSSDGLRAISGSEDKILKMWDIESGLCLATWQAAGAVRCCAATADTLVAGTGGGEVLFLKLMPPGRIIPETIATTWHPSRPFLAVARANGTILVQAWHPESRYLEELVRTSIATMTHLQWSSDGAHLRATARDNTTHVLDAATLNEVLVPRQSWADRFRRALRLSAPAAFLNWAAPRDISFDDLWRAEIRNGRLEIVPTAPPPNRAQ